jgi:leucyl-tRNA synthetase
MGGEESILVTSWPKYDPQAISEETCILVVQIDGKVRDRVEISRGLSQKEVQKIVLALPKLQSFLSGKKVAKFVLVPDRLANIVLKK